jgi:hypothetical protein
MEALHMDQQGMVENQKGGTHNLQVCKTTLSCNLIMHIYSLQQL